MSLPTFISSAHNETDSAAMLTVTHSVPLGSCALLAVAINGLRSSSAITDSAGNTGAGFPVNSWVLVSSSQLNGKTLELWACRSLVSSITAVTVHFLAAASFSVMLGAWTKTAALSSFITQGPIVSQNPHHANDLVVDISLPAPASAIMAGFFMKMYVPDQTLAMNTGTVRDNLNSDTVYPTLMLGDNAVPDTGGNIHLKVTSTHEHASILDASTVQGVVILLSSSFNIKTPPGFADLPQTSLAHDKPALGLLISKISQNAMFGMVRMEMFQGDYKHGDIVPAPASLVDGYQYTRDELTYIWAVKNTTNPSTGWISGPDNLWYCQWNVDQLTGTVTCEEYYRTSSSSTASHSQLSNDGVLEVTVIGQRQMKNLILADIPTLSLNASSAFAQDKPLTEAVLQNLNTTAKFGVVNSEVIYMGEFEDGATIPQAVSPADGFVYPYNKTAFQHSIRWTTQGTAYQQPPSNTGQLGPIIVTINSVGQLSVKVYYEDLNGNLHLVAGYGRVAIFALCSRTMAAVPDVSCPVLLAGPSGDVPGESFILRLKGSYISGFTAPSFSFSVKAAIHGLAIQRSSVLRTLAGSTAVVDSTPVTWDSGSASTTVAANAIKTCDTMTFALDSAHDYYFVVYLDAGAANNDYMYQGFVHAIGYGFGGMNQNIGDLTSASDVSGIAEDTSIWRMFSGFNASFSPIINAGVPSADFRELNSDLFVPGIPLTASAMKQIDANIREAVFSPEVFGPVEYHTGDIIPLPVSTNDSYAYQREELTYVWEISDLQNENNFPSSGAHARVPLWQASIDKATGKVVINAWRLPPGGHPVLDYPHYAKIRVTVLAFRQASSTAISTVTDLPCPVLTAGTDGAHDGSGVNHYLSGVRIVGPEFFGAAQVSAQFDMTLASGSGTSFGSQLTIFKVRWMKTLHCSPLITDSGFVLIGGNRNVVIPRSSSVQTDPFLLTMDSAHDLYIMIEWDGEVADAGFNSAGPYWDKVECLTFDYLHTPATIDDVTDLSSPSGFYALGIYGSRTDHRDGYPNGDGWQSPSLDGVWRIISAINFLTTSLNPPADLSTITADNNNGSNDTVNGT